jgi:TPR repeat protein
VKRRVDRGGASWGALTKAQQREMSEVIGLLRKAADQGDAGAQNNLGAMYYQGQGVKQDFGEALRLFQKAADQGNASAQCALGVAYAQGQGAKQDFSEAVRLYRKAADQGDANAQYNLGVAYAQGQGVKQDFGETVRLFRKAALQGHEGAKNFLPRAEENLRKQRQAAAASQPSTSNTCANCGVAEAAGGRALRPCSRCKAVVYCGKECQMQHWKAGGHKAVCK